ncbi:MAG TPA: hypothetical protein VIL65_14105 [Beijerinckiaceae bacterium]|jgi:hypothetical protein
MQDTVDVVGAVGTAFIQSPLGMSELIVGFIVAFGLILLAARGREHEAEPARFNEPSHRT